MKTENIPYKIYLSESEMPQNSVSYTHLTLPTIA